MAWSTRELAELAGTTLRAVRYYHEVGLLDPPERAVNGYKHYRIDHLLRLLRIRRLTELGMSLQQIREMGDLDDHPEEELRRLDSEVLASIRELQRVRAELGQLLETSGSVDLPADLARVVTDETTTASDRKLLVVMSRVLTPDELATLTALIAASPLTPAARDFDQLGEDATEEERQQLAERLLPESRSMRERFPGLPEISALGPDTPAKRAVQQALAEIYHDAQLDVLRRLSGMRLAD